MRFLGISAFYHDSAAALVVDGRVVAAAQEERFSRRKGDSSFPSAAVKYCLEAGNLDDASGLDGVVFYDKPIVTFERLLSSYLHRAPLGLPSFLKAIPLWLKEKLWMEDIIRKALPGAKEILFSRHHVSHAASAFYPSPFESAAIVTLDGVGEWDTCSVGSGSGRDLTLIESIKFPHSLGLFYSAFTYYCGFKVNSGEYKLMGLAPYGEPRFADLILDRIIQLGADGSFALDERYFDYVSGLRMISRRFERLFGAPPLPQGAVPTPFYMDVAASAQAVLDQAVLGVARRAREFTGERNLVMAGGVALNGVSNHRVLRDAGFERLWIQPAAGDAGGALGAALYAAHALSGEPRAHLPPAAAPEAAGAPSVPRDGMEGAFLGPCYADDESARRLAALGAVFTPLPDAELLDAVAADLEAGKVVGWFQGRMEFGPRALGARSILGDPRSPEMQKTMNLKIKFRESFRPFAPAVLAERSTEWFDLPCDSPYMLLVCQVSASRRLPGPGAEPRGLDRLGISRSTIPAVTHVDGSARIQTVDGASNPRFHALLSAWEGRTGCPVLINTSFNVRGEPIVLSPEDAFRCFMGTDMDVLVVGNLRMAKADQATGSAVSELVAAWKERHVQD